MASRTSTVRRRAWINSSRHWPTLEDPDGPLCSIPSASTVDDDVFSDGCFTGKIEDWLLGCGSNSSSTEISTQLSVDSVQQANTCNDDLSLGADASALNGGKTASKACLKQHPSVEQQRRFSRSSRQKGLCPPSLNLGHSIASSCLSSSTWKSTSSVSDVLDMYSEDAEETLFDLGFGCEVPQVTVRIPPRFFTFPSQARGINFRLFLDSQLRRIREEDPNLSLASRFRQVQVLTAMANAFYSLYSHVSRTPLQKLATPEFTFSSPVERIERFRSSVRSEPRSPVERLKDTVSKMCLYPGSPRGSDSSPQSSPRRRSSLPEIVDIMFKSKSGAAKKLDLGDNQKDSCLDFKPIAGGDRSCKSDKTKQSVEDTDSIQSENKVEEKTLAIRDGEENCIKKTEFDSRTVKTSPLSTLSGETVIEREHQFLSCRAESDSHLPPLDTETAEPKPVARVTYDLICPQITESVHQVNFCCQNTQSFPHISSESKDKPQSHEPQTRTPVSEDVRISDGPSAGELTHVNVLKCSVPQNNCSDAQCSITVTGWEGDDLSCSLNAASQASSLQMCEEVFHQKERQYLNPHHSLSRLTANLQQVNSFELEEVHSAGEEDFGHSVKGATSPLSMRHQHKGEVVRGDSVQSDSSGYADEEVFPQSGRHS